MLYCELNHIWLVQLSLQVRSLHVILMSHTDSESFSRGNKRRLYTLLVVAIAQPLLMWWLTWRLAPADWWHVRDIVAQWQSCCYWWYNIASLGRHSTNVVNRWLLFWLISLLCVIYCTLAGSDKKVNPLLIGSPGPEKSDFEDWKNRSWKVLIFDHKGAEKSINLVRWLWCCI